MGLGFGRARGHEGVPGHVREAVGAGEVVGGLEERTSIGRVVRDRTFGVV